MFDDVPRKSLRATRKGRERRDKILEVAAQVFREHGFEATSMSQIAALAGGSKGTLYNYFPSKEDLLLATMLRGAHEFTQEVLMELDAEGELATELRRFLVPLLSKLYAKETAQLLRVVVSVGGQSDVGRRFYSMLDNEIWNNITSFIARQSERGVLRPLEPQLMSDHLRGLCESEILVMLMGAMSPWDDEQVRREADKIIDLFQRAYSRDAP